MACCPMKCFALPDGRAVDFSRRHPRSDGAGRAEGEGDENEDSRHDAITITRYNPFMRIGMNLLLWTSHVTAEHFAVLDKLKATGFDGVEVPIFEGDEAHYKMLGREIKSAGLECSTITVCIPDPPSQEPE